MLHRSSAREFGKPTSLWTLALAAEVSFEEGITEEQVSAGTVRATLERMGVRWLRAKRWITRAPTPSMREKRRRDRLIGLSECNPGWVVGFEDETWWSRLALPWLHAWGEDSEPSWRLEQRSVAKDDPDPKAISCYGLYLPELDERTWLRFVDGRPGSGVTTRFLSWCSKELAEGGKEVLVLVWDNASWHISKEVRRWIGEHNRRVKKGEKEGVRIVSCLLPKKSPWLNPIEPKWMHGASDALWRRSAC